MANFVPATTLADANQRLEAAERLLAQEKSKTEFLTDIGKAAVETAKVAGGSTEAVVNTIADQTFRATFKPGETLTDGGKAVFAEVVGVAPKKVSGYQNQFIGTNPRLDPKSVQYAPQGRKGPKLAPKKAFGKNLRKHTVRVSRGTARRMKQHVDQTLKNMVACGRQDNNNFTENEARKYLNGYFVTHQSGSARERASLFNGSGDNIRHDRA